MVNEFTLPAMSCGHCIGVITGTVQSIDPQARIQADLERRSVRVESERDRAQLEAALTDAGYPPA
jgi:copper chaperone